MLNVQKYIIDCVNANLDPFKKLYDEFAIKSTIYPEDGMVILNYSQIESPKSHPIVIECRSLILNIYTLGVVSRKFDRFFNHGECPDFYSDFDINRSYVFTKEDGSLIGVYYNHFTSKWEISTRSLAKAEGDHITGGTFREKVLSAFGYQNEEHFQNVMKDYRKDMTYIYEYVGPSNRIVTRYDYDHMVLTAIRNNYSGEYQSYNMLLDHSQVQQDMGLNVVPVKSYNLSSFDEIKKAIDELPALAEGYVCFDPVSGKRVKCKSPGYVAIHGLRENGALSMKRAYTLVLINDHEEYLTAFPEDVEHFNPVISRVNQFMEDIKTAYEKVKNITDQKTFALACKEYYFSGILFTARKNEITPIQCFNRMEVNQKLKYFL